MSISLQKLSRIKIAYGEIFTIAGNFIDGWSEVVCDIFPCEFDVIIKLLNDADIDGEFYVYIWDTDEYFRARAKMKKKNDIVRISVKSEKCYELHDVTGTAMCIDFIGSNYSNNDARLVVMVEQPYLLFVMGTPPSAW